MKSLQSQLTNQHMDEKWRELIWNRNLKTQNLKEREMKIPFSLTDVKIENMEIKSNF